jgi:hypothetical protein
MYFHKKTMYKMTIKNIALFLLICGLLFSCQTKENKNGNLESTIVQVVKAFKEKDAATLNSLIPKEKGLIVLFKRGTMDEYGNTEKIDFEKPVPEYLPNIHFVTDYKTKFESLPTYDCETMKWTKQGLFCDSVSRDSLLSRTALNLNQFRGDSIPASEIKRFVEHEKNSRRIVLSDNDNGELVFYLTLIENKWYLTMLDTVTSDCGA